MATQKKISFALQGGGAQGAFTWGVLDRFLEDGRVEVEAFTGASAGAMNALAFVDGWIKDGPEGARAKLEEFWRAVSLDGRWSSAQQAAIGALMTNYGTNSVFADLWSEWFKYSSNPYRFNLLDINPLRALLEEEIDFEGIRAQAEFQLYFSATNVETGEIKIFQTDELTPDHVLASACLPKMFKAVVIDDVPYWDGGYVGNPALFPLFRQCKTQDIVVVQLNPTVRKGIPRTTNQINERLSEITFNATLIREVRFVDTLTRMVSHDRLPFRGKKRLLMHRIDSGDLFSGTGSRDAANPRWLHLTKLRDAGREAAADWLRQNFGDLGKRSTIEISSAFD